MKKTIFFRADGNSEIGLGHVIRSLALADMLKEKFACRFIIENPLESLRHQILAVCDNMIALQPEHYNSEIDFLLENYLKEGDVIVLDGYHFGEAYQECIKKAGCKLAFIDDIQHTHFLADIVINHAQGLTAKEFSKEEYTKLLLGDDFALLRAPFIKAAAKERSIKAINSIFICFGGADFNNLSLKVLEQFSSFKVRKYTLNIVLGGAHKFVSEVKDFAKSISDFEVNIHQNLDAEQMVALMQENDCAIVPASSILYEVLAVKMPVISGYYVDNQINIYHGFNNTGLIMGVGDLNTFSDYETVLNAFTTSSIATVLQKQNELGIANAPNNFVQVFDELFS